MSTARDKYLTIFEIIPNPAFILDVENRIDIINNVGVELFREILSHDAVYEGKVQVETLFPWLADELNDFAAGDESERGLQKDVETKRGIRHFEVKLKRMLDVHEKFIGTMVILNDISHLKQAERSIAKARDFYLTLFEEFPAMIWRAGLDGECNYFNKAWLSFTGRTPEEELNSGWQEGVSKDDLKTLQETYSEALKSRKNFEMEFRLRRSDGKYRWVVDFGRPFYDLEGGFGGYIGACYDITERKEHEERLTLMALHDSLTGLPNRRKLEDYLSRAISLTGRGGKSGLLFIDLDNFKKVNDNFGHATGDQVLISFGLLMKQQVRESDLIARLGGDEFGVLLEGMAKKEAFTVAERLRITVEQKVFIFEGKMHKMTFSAGLVIIEGKEKPEYFMSRADSAMYQAKEKGGNQVVVVQEGS